MAGTNEYVPFANGSSALVLAPATYAADSQLAIGNQPGIARVDLVNTTLRQSSMIAAAVANFIANQLDENVNDDGNLGNLIVNLTTALASVGSNLVAITSSGNFTVPANVYRMKVRLVGGGGGGAGSSASASGGSGGAGGYAEGYVSVTPGEVIPVTVGAAGAAGVASAAGGAGGTTTFGTFASTTGGGAGLSVASSGGAGGTATGTGFLLAGGDWGTDGNNGSIITSSGSGGTSPFGGAGRAGYGGGASASGYGSGGGGAYGASSSGGAGGGGVVVVEY